MSREENVGEHPNIETEKKSFAFGKERNK